MLLSGGVDSTVCAALLKKSLTREGQVIAIHIDNGFMRKNESEQVKASLEKLGLQLKGKACSYIFRWFVIILIGSVY